MEQHPVPQNILQVEFKLFGSFTMKQFLRIMIGCLIALGFVISGLPFYISLPFAGASLLLGFGTAIIPNLGVWLSGFIKSMFISPRYVWQKAPRTPAELQRKAKQDIRNVQQVTKAKNTSKVDLTEISLSKLLATRGGATQQSQAIDALDLQSQKPNNQVSAVQQNPQTNTQPQMQQQVVQARNGNIDRVMGEVFKKEIEQKQKQKLKQQEVQKEFTSREDYIDEINRLKIMLDDMVKIEGDEEQEKEIMDRINNLTKQVQLLEKTNNVTPQTKSTNSQMVRDFKGQLVGEGQVIIGLIVDARDNPVAEAKVKFSNIAAKDIFETTSGEDGRFATEDKIIQGKYMVNIEHPNFRFHTYEIEVGAQKLPAYKFRAK